LCSQSSFTSPTSVCHGGRRCRGVGFPGEAQPQPSRLLVGLPGTGSLTTPIRRWERSVRPRSLAHTASGLQRLRRLSALPPRCGEISAGGDRTPPAQLQSRHSLGPDRGSQAWNRRLFDDHTGFGLLSDSCQAIVWRWLGRIVGAVAVVSNPSAVSSQPNVP
jgi:hypothetical protein